MLNNQTGQNRNNRSTAICYSFQRGDCNRGDSCRYEHVKRSNRGDSNRNYHSNTESLRFKKSRYGRGTRYDQKYEEKKTNINKVGEDPKPRWEPEESPDGSWAKIASGLTQGVHRLPYRQIEIPDSEEEDIGDDIDAEGNEVTQIPLEEALTYDNGIGEFVKKYLGDNK